MNRYKDPEYQKKYYEKNKDIILEQSAEYKSINAEQIKVVNAVYTENHKEEQKIRSAKWYVDNKEKVLLRTYINRIKTQGWTIESYEEKLIEQDGRCAICGIQVKGRFCTDHEHIFPPNPRGLLCSSCNSALGLFKDSPELLRIAAVYIEKHRKPISEGEKLSDAGENASSYLPAPRFHCP